MLSDIKIRNSKPREKAYRVYDTRGLYMIVTPTGRRWWRFKYRFGGRERGMCFGVYPDVPLKYAREKREEARQLIARGVDPSMQRQLVRAARANTFRIVAEEWLSMQAERFAPITMSKARWILESFIYPRVGDRPIGDIAAPEMLMALRPVEHRGMHETAHRAMQRCGQIFRYAVATGRAARDITADLRGALAPVVVKNRAAITELSKIGAFLRAIDGYDGYSTTGVALKLSPLVFVHPGELRAAEWREIDLEAAEWRIPAERMKMRERHIVPLSKQALALLHQLRAITGKSKHAFPSLRYPTRPMSNNTITAALPRLGYNGDEMTAHGFRAMASTCLNELGWHPDLIELQLAHAERNKVRAAYNRAERLSDRTKMMQEWADHLDRLRVTKSASPPEHVAASREFIANDSDAQRPRESRQAKHRPTRNAIAAQLDLFDVNRS